MKTDLIYDVGMHSGQDTAFYLASGYRVIAIEADPALVEAAAARFTKELAEGRLTIVPCCISDQRGETDFWINRVDSALSSFDRRSAERRGHPVVNVRVACVRLADLFRDHGVPHYLKVDIELADRFCIEDLSASALPAYVSVEMTDLSFLIRLRDLGYSRFKLVEQVKLTSLTEQIPADQRLLNIVCRDLGSRKLSLRVQRRAARWLHPPVAKFEASRRSPVVSRQVPGWNFEEGCSGPFGEDTHGEWMGWEDITYVWALHLRHHRARNAELWCDLHAAL